MNMLLAIEISSDESQVVLGLDRKPIFDSSKNCDYGPSTNIGSLVSSGLASINAHAAEIKGVAVNVGPGNLTSIRTGVSFVNALAFSLGIGIYPFNYFEIIAYQTRNLREIPLLCAVPAANNHAYVALITGSAVEVMRYGPLPSVVADLSNNLFEVAVAGKIRHRLSSLLNGVKVIDTGIEKLDVNVLLELGYRAYESPCAPSSHVSPLNDQSEVFYV